MIRNTTVAVLGGGVAGLTAAHELAERGFAVTLYEANAASFGGKARSIPVAGSGTAGRRDLPGEHGFRFFPGFYRHIPDTMRRIPYPGNANGVLDNLVSVEQMQIARAGDSELHLCVHAPRNMHELLAWIQAVFCLGETGIGIDEAAFFASRLWVLLTSCSERRFAEYEHISWWDFIDAENRSEPYRQYLARGLTRTLVAMRAEHGSARTVGYTLLALLFDAMRPGSTADRVLVGPTNDVWIDPWVDHLRRLEVKFQPGARVVALRVAPDSRRICSVTVEIDGECREVVADHYVCALPHQVLAKLVDAELAVAAPSLANLHRLAAEWMNGIQFDISDWDTPGILYGRPARQCSAQEIRDEVWAQLVAHLDDGAEVVLEEATVIDWFLDPTLEFRGPRAPHNPDPLLVNIAGSWRHRPDAATELDNLVVAGDYVRTSTDLATMEAANESARRAVNAILDRVGARQPRCAVMDMYQPAALAPLRALDRARFALGRSHVMLPETARKLDVGSALSG
jgi:15-cis-phytoene desaturase